MSLTFSWSSARATQFFSPRVDLAAGIKVFHDDFEADIADDTVEEAADDAATWKKEIRIKFDTIDLHLLVFTN